MQRDETRVALARVHPGQFRGHFFDWVMRAVVVAEGGYGERIAAGLAVNDNQMLLAGAVPAAILALLVQGMFDLVDRWADPRRKP